MTFIEQIDSWLAAIFGGPAAPVSKPPSPAGKADPLSASGTPPAGASTKPVTSKSGKLVNVPIKKKGAKFGAAAKGVQLKGSSTQHTSTLTESDLPVRNLAIQKLLENARNAEANYDELKNKEGAGGFTRQMYEKGTTLKAVYDNPIAGIVDASKDMGDVAQSGALISVSGQTVAYSKGLKKAFYDAHEKSVKRAISYAVPPWHTVVKSEHRGEEYVWNHVVITGPGFFASA